MVSRYAAIFQSNDALRDRQYPRVVGHDRYDALIVARDIGQQLRDLDAVHGFAGRVSRSLDPSEVAETAVSDFVDMMRAESAALVRFGDDGTATVHASGPIPLRLPDRREDELADIGNLALRQILPEAVRIACHSGCVAARPPPTPRGRSP